MHADDTTSIEPDEDDTTPSNVPPDETTTDEVVEFETTTSDAEDTTTVQPPHDPPQFCWGDDCQNRAARDCSNGTCGRCCQLYGRYHCERHNS